MKRFPMSKHPEKNGLERSAAEWPEAIQETVKQHPGILRVALDRKGGAVEVDYNPETVSRETLEQTAQQILPLLSGHSGKSIFRLKGRACEGCAQRIQYGFERSPGIRRARASYIGGVLSIEYDREQWDAEQLLRKTRDMGVKVQPIREALREEEQTVEGWRRWIQEDRLEAVCCGLTLAAMSAGALSGYLLPESKGLTFTLFLVAYLAGGWFGVQSALESLRQKVVDIDLLMILAALGAAVIGAPFEGALLLFLFSLSNVMQSHAMEKTRSAIKALAKLRPTEARVRQSNGDYVSETIEQVAVGSHVLIKPGERIPLDGIVTEGESSVDQSSVTGESIPANKGAGDPVFAGSLNQFGSLVFRVTHPAEDSTLAKMILMVEEAQSKKAKTQRFLDKTEQSYALGVIVFTVFLIFALPLIFGLSWSDAFYRAITVMVVASPCAIIISTPASILSAIGNGARRGILFKGGASLEQAAAIHTVAFDKTGTLTMGKPAVRSIKSLGSGPQRSTGVPPVSSNARGHLSVAALTQSEDARGPFPSSKQTGPSPEEHWLALAAGVESHSEHPLAQAVLTYARERGVRPETVSGFNAFAGKGAWGVCGHERVLVGSLSWMRQFTLARENAVLEAVREMQATGQTVIVVGILRDAPESVEVLGVIGLADEIRPEAREALADLRRSGVRRIVMLTGDSTAVARAVADELGIDEYHAELLPGDKVRLMKQLSDGAPVAMVGDGTNDAPALASSTLGIAMGAAGSDVALESADVVLMASDLSKTAYVLKLSRAARRVMVQNLVFAGSIIVLMVLATLFLPLTGWEVPLPLGVLAHEGGTVLVCLNGLRLLAFNGK